MSMLRRLVAALIPLALLSGVAACGDDDDDDDTAVDSAAAEDDVCAWIDRTDAEFTVEEADELAAAVDAADLPGEEADAAEVVLEWISGAVDLYGDDGVVTEDEQSELLAEDPEGWDEYGSAFAVLFDYCP
jgi:hypothetical protein